MSTEFVPTEYDEACTLAEWLEYQRIAGKIKQYTHCAQETFTRSFKTKNKNKMQGVRPGLPDYIIITYRHVIFIELKRHKKSLSKISVAQGEWIADLKTLGPPIVPKVCYGASEAIELVDTVIRLEGAPHATGGPAT